MRNFKSILLSLIVFLMLGITFGLRSRTSFSKVGVPIAQPQTAFFSWGCVANAAGACSSTGKYRASGTLLMQIGSGWEIRAYIPLLDGSGNVFLTGGSTSWVYLTIADSGVYFNINSGTYFEAHSWTYFETNSWTYFESNSWTYFLAHSGEYFEANSGTYYTTNPLWYITWVDLSAYISGYTVATTWWVYSWDSTILATTRATSEYIDTYSQSLGDVYTTWYFYVSGSTISRLWLLSWVMTMQDYTWGNRVPQICVSEANSWTYFNANSWTYFNTNSGSFVQMSMTGNWNTAYGWWNHALYNYLVFTGGSVLNTWRTYPGTWTQVPTTFGVSTYLNTLAQDLWDVMTTGSYIMTATGTVNQWSWRMQISWGNLSFQVYTGGAWIEKGFFTSN